MKKPSTPHFLLLLLLMVATAAVPKKTTRKKIAQGLGVIATVGAAITGGVVIDQLDVTDQFVLLNNTYACGFNETHAVRCEAYYEFRNPNNYASSEIDLQFQDNVIDLLDGNRTVAEVTIHRRFGHYEKGVLVWQETPRIYQGRNIVHIYTDEKPWTAVWDWTTTMNVPAKVLGAKKQVLWDARKDSGWAPWGDLGSGTSATINWFGGNCGTPSAFRWQNNGTAFTLQTVQHRIVAQQGSGREFCIQIFNGTSTAPDKRIDTNEVCYNTGLSMSVDRNATGYSAAIPANGYVWIVGNPSNTNCDFYRLGETLGTPNIATYCSAGDSGYATNASKCTTWSAMGSNVATVNVKLYGIATPPVTNYVNATNATITQSSATLIGWCNAIINPGNVNLTNTTAWQFQYRWFNGTSLWQNGTTSASYGNNTNVNVHNVTNIYPSSNNMTLECTPVNSTTGATMVPLNGTAAMQFNLSVLQPDVKAWTYNGSTYLASNLVQIAYRFSSLTDQRVAPTNQNDSGAVSIWRIQNNGTAVANNLSMRMNDTLPTGIVMGCSNANVSTAATNLTAVQQLISDTDTNPGANTSIYCWVSLNNPTVGKIGKNLFQYR